MLVIEIHHLTLYRVKTVKIDNLEVYTDRKEAYRKGKLLRLSRREYDLLEFLMLNRGRIFNRNTLLEYVWQHSTDILTNTVDVHIAHLRRKVDLGYEKKLIQTVFGVGYKVSNY